MLLDTHPSLASLPALSPRNLTTSPSPPDAAQPTQTRRLTDPQIVSNNSLILRLSKYIQSISRLVSTPHLEHALLMVSSSTDVPESFSRAWLASETLRVSSPSSSPLRKARLMASSDAWAVGLGQFACAGKLGVPFLTAMIGIVYHGSISRSNWLHRQ